MKKTLFFLLWIMPFVASSQITSKQLADSLNKRLSYFYNREKKDSTDLLALKTQIKTLSDSLTKLEDSVWKLRARVLSFPIAGSDFKVVNGVVFVDYSKVNLLNIDEYNTLKASVKSANDYILKLKGLKLSFVAQDIKISSQEIVVPQVNLSIPEYIIQVPPQTIILPQ